MGKGIGSPDTPPHPRRRQCVGVSGSSSVTQVGPLIPLPPFHRRLQESLAPSTTVRLTFDTSFFNEADTFDPGSSSLDQSLSRPRLQKTQLRPLFCPRPFQCCMSPSLSSILTCRLQNPAVGSTPIWSTMNAHFNGGTPPGTLTRTSHHPLPSPPF